MQTPSFRYLVLIAILLFGVGLSGGFPEAHGAGTPRWPKADGLYAVDGWSVSHEQNADGGFVARTFRDQAGRTAMLSIFSDQTPKLYGAGAEVPLLGSGYSVEPAPSDLVTAVGDGINTLIARRSDDHWLVISAYGERRGLLGNGGRAWAFALFDGILGRPNDYYKVFLAARADSLDIGFAQEVTALATTLFRRIANFYAA